MADPTSSANNPSQPELLLLRLNSGGVSSDHLLKPSQTSVFSQAALIQQDELNGAHSSITESQVPSSYVLNSQILQPVNLMTNRLPKETMVLTSKFALNEELSAEDLVQTERAPASIPETEYTRQRSVRKPQAGIKGLSLDRLSSRKQLEGQAITGRTLLDAPSVTPEQETGFIYGESKFQLPALIGSTQAHSSTGMGTHLNNSLNSIEQPKALLVKKVDPSLKAEALQRILSKTRLSNSIIQSKRARDSSVKGLADLRSVSRIEEAGSRKLLEARAQISLSTQKFRNPERVLQLVESTDRKMKGKRLHRQDTLEGSIKTFGGLGELSSSDLSLSNVKRISSLREHQKKQKEVMLKILKKQQGKYRLKEDSDRYRTETDNSLKAHFSKRSLGLGAHTLEGESTRQSQNNPVSSMKTKHEAMSKPSDYDPMPDYHLMLPVPSSQVNFTTDNSVQEATANLRLESSEAEFDLDQGGDSILEHPTHILSSVSQSLLGSNPPPKQPKVQGEAEKKKIEKASMILDKQEIRLSNCQDRIKRAVANPPTLSETLASTNQERMDLFFKEPMEYFQAVSQALFQVFGFSGDERTNEVPLKHGQLYSKALRKFIEQVTDAISLCKQNFSRNLEICLSEKDKVIGDQQNSIAELKARIEALSEQLIDENNILSDERQASMRELVNEFLKEPSAHEGDNVFKILENNTYSGVRTDLQEVMQRLKTKSTLPSDEDDQTAKTATFVDKNMLTQTSGLFHKRLQQFLLEKIKDVQRQTSKKVIQKFHKNIEMIEAGIQVTLTDDQVLKQLEFTNKVLRREVEDLKEHIKGEQVVFQGLRRKNDDLRSQNQALTSSQNRLEAQLEEQRAHHNKVETKIRRLEEQFTDEVASKQSVIEKYQKSQSKCVDLDLKMADLRGKVSELQFQLRKSQENATVQEQTLKTELNQLQSALEGARASLAESEQERTRQLEQNQDQLRQIKELKVQHTQLDMKSQRLSKEIAKGRRSESITSDQSSAFLPKSNEKPRNTTILNLEAPVPQPPAPVPVLSSESGGDEKILEENETSSKTTEQQVEVLSQPMVADEEEKTELRPGSHTSIDDPLHSIAQTPYDNLESIDHAKKENGEERELVGGESQHSSWMFSMQKRSDSDMNSKSFRPFNKDLNSIDQGTGGGPDSTNPVSAQKKPVYNQLSDEAEPRDISPGKTSNSSKEDRRRETGGDTAGRIDSSERFHRSTHLQDPTLRTLDARFYPEIRGSFKHSPSNYKYLLQKSHLDKADQLMSELITTRLSKREFLNNDSEPPQNQSKLLFHQETQTQVSTETFLKILQINEVQRAKQPILKGKSVQCQRTHGDHLVKQYGRHIFDFGQQVTPYDLEREQKILVIEETSRRVLCSSSPPRKMHPIILPTQVPTTQALPTKNQGSALITISNMKDQHRGKRQPSMNHTIQRASTDSVQPKVKTSDHQTRQSSQNADLQNLMGPPVEYSYGLSPKMAEESSNLNNQPQLPLLEKPIPKTEGQTQTNLKALRQEPIEIPELEDNDNYGNYGNHTNFKTNAALNIQSSMSIEAKPQRSESKRALVELNKPRRQSASSAQSSAGGNAAGVLKSRLSISKERDGMRVVERKERREEYLKNVKSLQISSKGNKL